MRAIWRQLDSLGPDLCHACTFCKNLRSHTQFCRLYYFLARLYDEFEPLRAQLLARHPKVPQLEALTEVRWQEICLHNRGTLSAPFILTAWIPTPSSSSRSTASPTTSEADLCCTYCNKEGYLKHCRFKKKDIAARHIGWWAKIIEDFSHPILSVWYCCLYLGKIVRN